MEMMAPPTIQVGDLAHSARQDRAEQLAPGKRPIYWYATEGAFSPEHYDGRPIDIDNAGVDLASVADVTIEPGGWGQVPSNIHVEIPSGHWVLLIGRSSTLFQKRLIVVPTVIDCGYRGPLFAMVHNPNREVCQVQRGDRLVQMIPLPQLLHNTLAMVPSQEGLSPSMRGAKGLGSSGK